MPLLFMATKSLVSVEEYLNTSYRPDCDYVDGVLVERNVGQFDHGRLQAMIAAYYVNRRKQWRIHVSTEQRVQVSPTRFRIPDVCVTAEEHPQQISRPPPLLCIEILSPEDRLSAVRQRVMEFLNFGVRYVWIVDPTERKAWRCTADGMHEVAEFRTENPDTLVPLAELFD